MTSWHFHYIILTFFLDDSEDVEKFQVLIFMLFLLRYVLQIIQGTKYSLGYLECFVTDMISGHLFHEMGYVSKLKLKLIDHGACELQQSMISDHTN